MKKISIIIIVSISLIVLVFLGFYLISRESGTPVRETVRDILPFGSGGNGRIPGGLRDGDGMFLDSEGLPQDEFANPAASLFRISDTPVAGATVFSRGSQTIVRYADRATGHIYDRNLGTFEETKVTNNTLPKIYEAYFRPDGNAVLFRSLRNNSDVVENLALSLTPPQATSVSTSSLEASGALYSVSATPLRGDITAVTVGPGNVLVYALGDASTIVSSAFNGSGTRTLLTSPFTDWRLAGTGSVLVLHTKPSSVASGFAYTLGLSSGTLTKILGPLNGLVAIPNTLGTRVLYSYVENNQTKLFAKNLSNNALAEILPTTLADKCVWETGNTGILFCGAPIESPGAGEPDHWYRGETHFSDRLWLFDTNLNTAEVLSEPRQSLRIDIDVFEPKLSPNGDYLVFMNKTDLSLWALRLEGL
ncbi:MAG: hypothetical protein WD896_02840 [Parcubacteria group bacterium]